MEIVNIDAKTFESMLSKFENFASRMEALCRLNNDMDIREWMDNEDVCRLLNISPRTLQTLRDNRTLAYSRINNKLYYKPSVGRSGSPTPRSITSTPLLIKACLDSSIEAKR